MKLLSPVISSIARLRKWRIDNWTNHPVAAQREVLQHLVTSAQYTEFGRKYSFHKLFNVKEFKAVVPIHEYEDLKPYIERMMQGKENILWNEPVYWFAKSSGTTRFNMVTLVQCLFKTHPFGANGYAPRS